MTPQDRKRTCGMICTEGAEKEKRVSSLIVPDKRGTCAMCVVIKLCAEEAVNSDYRECQESIGKRRNGHFD